MKKSNNLFKRADNQEISIKIGTGLATLVHNILIKMILTYFIYEKSATIFSTLIENKLFILIPSTLMKAEAGF